MGPVVLMLLLGNLYYGSASPTINSNHTTLIVAKGDPVNLICSGNATIEWVGIVNKAKVEVYNNGTLYIPRASCKEMGNYQCAYVNRTNEETASVYLIVRDPKTPWCLTKENIEAIEGSDALLPCLITDPGFTGNITLMKGEEQIISSRFSFSPQKGIHLHRVNMTHKGRSFLDFLAISKPVSVTIETKDNVRMTTHERDDSINYITEQILSIPAVQFHDSGEYTCFGKSSAGTSNASAYLRVIAPPQVKVKPNSSNSLWCEASGYPVPRIEWYKLPHNHSTDRCSQDGMLFLNDTIPEIISEPPFGRVSLISVLQVKEMEGNMIFCCLAVNSAGNESSFGSLVHVVEGPVLVITEYCPYGDLLNFLRTKAECLIIQDLTLEPSLDSRGADYKNVYLGKKYLQSRFGGQCTDSYLEMRSMIASSSVQVKGRSPYPGMKVNSKFYSLVKQGYHMGRPDFAPDDMITKTCRATQKKKTVDVSLPATVKNPVNLERVSNSF
ncbi:hypothetical protein JD844_012251 [Phrynosoma platyrhinos]|uniref:Ig-like domain-containing protein n=1 Tax=Phrynosoma platyrhinos TaxID=52577 RepID=A0ABQ7TJ92_PHRPL|nr:hypothetical protein JD844_012251 [Phrynosoma platyrhinos]